MKILFEMRHPAHFHHFKHTIRKLRENNHKVKVIVSSKDVLVELLSNSNISYELIGKNTDGINKKIFEIILQIIRVYKICKRFKPDLIVGRPSPTITLNSRLLNIPSIIFAEDDFNAVFLNGIIAYPFAKIVLAPNVTDLGPFNRKKIGYSGYQKLAYLHPNIFKPNLDNIKEYIDISKPFFIMRFAKLNAGHDIKAKGITEEFAKKIIDIIKPYGNIYISSERELEKEFEKYRIQLPSQFIHDALYFAKMFVGDSQTMTAEAALLGTPSLRYSYFTGKLSYLEELEKEYKLTFGFKINEKRELLEKIQYLLNLSEIDVIWKERRKKLLKDKIDVSAFMIWFIENYPKSVKIMKQNPDYQYKFK